MPSSDHPAALRLPTRLLRGVLLGLFCLLLLVDPVSLSLAAGTSERALDCGCAVKMPCCKAGLCPMRAARRSGRRLTALEPCSGRSAPLAQAPLFQPAGILPLGLALAPPAGEDLLPLGEGARPADWAHPPHHLPPWYLSAVSAH